MEVIVVEKKKKKKKHRTQEIAIELPPVPNHPVQRDIEVSV